MNKSINLFQFSSEKERKEKKKNKNVLSTDPKLVNGSEYC